METLEEMQARHQKEQEELQARISNKKNNATNRTRKGINNECAQLETQLRERQQKEASTLIGETPEEEPNESEAQQLKLEAISISEQPEQPTSAEQPPSAEQPKKKRNRQKERMARRAAEKEAAAEAAEQEVANMVDHKKIEKTRMLKEFDANSLVEHEIKPDGHCLFSAVADQLQSRGILLSRHASDGAQPYKLVRDAAATYMETHADVFAPFMEDSFDSHVTKIRDTAEWGGQLELLAIARSYGVEISVVQEGRTEFISPGIEGPSKPERIWLAYYRHGYGLGEHYNSLRKAP